jgi:hypothetical protein
MMKCIKDVQDTAYIAHFRRVSLLSALANGQIRCLLLLLTNPDEPYPVHKKRLEFLLEWLTL